MLEHGFSFGEVECLTPASWNARFDRIDPYKIIKTGPGYDVQGDPMTVLERELAQHKYVKIPEIPTFTGACRLFLPLLSLRV